MTTEPVTYVPDFLSPAFAATTFNRLRDELDWLRLRRRSEYWATTLGKPYTYGGGEDGNGPGAVTYEPQPTHELIDQIRDTMFGGQDIAPLEGCFLNRYLNGLDALGWHADDDRGIDHTRPIAVVTLGTGRILRYKAQVPGTKPTEVFLEPGSLLLMHPGMQQTHFHAIPPVPKQDNPETYGERISMTYRGLVS
ncbi:hypothetical protein BAJUN_00630 [Bajunvirus bajun]|uniref:Fe2OG dioxygenase domain-containing protein n=1 Tax=Brevundimonas phage vB_BgoS-Bajun TaxID=2948594 RepID=A0A9E7N4F4_9CAUD|nr:hypothetical protein BAJUN_00630 [Brevundimonas phage vB_BgoS-Bajun]